MRVKVVGIEKVNYTKKDGTPVSGCNLFYTSPIPQERGVGDSCGSEYVSASKVGSRSLSLGEYDFEYSRTRDGRAYLSSFEFVGK